MTDLDFYTAICRNYKNTYVWKCPCGKKTQVYFHRTEEEFKKNKSPIKQLCSSRHVSIPQKFCNRCNTEHEVSEITCNNCEPAVIVLAKKMMAEENGL